LFAFLLTGLLEKFCINLYEIFEEKATDFRLTVMTITFGILV